MPMFTGIVPCMASVQSVKTVRGKMQLTLLLPKTFGRLPRRGASVSVAGVCLTVVSAKGRSVRFDVIGETLKRSSLGKLAKGNSVNVEGSFHVGDEIGGHVVSGHVLCTARVLSRRDASEETTLGISLPSKAAPYVFEKGFLAVDGVSLTVGTVRTSSFDLHLIPETLRRTTFGALREGSLVNLEPDAQTVTVVETLRRLAPRIFRKTR